MAIRLKVKTILLRELLSKPRLIERIYHNLSTLIQHMPVNHCVFQITMPLQCLNRANIGALLQQMRGETMSKSLVIDCNQGSRALICRFELIRTYTYVNRHINDKSISNNT